MLRPYQAEAVEIILKELQQNVKEQILCFATGLGKTKTAISVLNNFNRTLWLTSGIELIEQSAMAIIHDEFDDVDLLNLIEEKGGIIAVLELLEKNTLFSDNKLNVLKDHIGIIKQERFDINAKIVVASVQTLIRRLEKIPQGTFDCIIVDECHLAMAKSWLTSLEHFKPQLLLGLSATPMRTDGAPMTDLFEKIVFERDIKFGVDHNFLCEIDALRVKTTTNLDTVRTTGGELNQGDLKLLNTPERNSLIVQKWVQYAGGRQTLAFATDIQHAQDLCKAFKNTDILADFVASDTSICPDRKDRIKKFTSGATMVMVNVGILTTGFDYPNVSCVLMARPTKSKVLYYQCIGRGTRLKTEGCEFKNLLILDVVDVTKRHSLINTWTLDEDKDLEDKVFLSDEKRQKLREVRENRKAIALKELIKKDEKVELFKLPKVYISKSERMKEPATVAQLEYLKRLGYDIEGNTYTKGQCSELISSSPASEAQVWRLEKEGYDVKGGVTVGIAKLAFEEIKEREAKKQLNATLSPIPDNLKRVFKL